MFVRNVFSMFVRNVFSAEYIQRQLNITRYGCIRIHTELCLFGMYSLSLSGKKMCFNKDGKHTPTSESASFAGSVKL